MLIDSKENMPIYVAVDTKEFVHEFSVVTKVRIDDATSVISRKSMVNVVCFSSEGSTRKTVCASAAQRLQNFGQLWTDRANSRMPCAQGQAALVIDREHT